MLKYLKEDSLSRLETEHYFWVFSALHNACYVVDAQKLLNECNPFGWKGAVSNAVDPK